jgi:hypothetical protein
MLNSGPPVNSCFKLQLYIINAACRLHYVDYQFCLKEVVSGLCKVGLALDRYGTG